MLLSKAEKKYLENEKFIEDYKLTQPELGELIDILIQIRDGKFEYSYPKKLSIMVGKQLNDTFNLYLRNSINACNVKVKLSEHYQDIFVYIKDKHENVCAFTLNSIQDLMINKDEHKRITIMFHHKNGLDYQITL